MERCYKVETIDQLRKLLNCRPIAVEASEWRNALIGLETIIESERLNTGAGFAAVKRVREAGRRFEITAKALLGAERRPQR